MPLSTHIIPSRTDNESIFSMNNVKNMLTKTNVSNMIGLLSQINKLSYHASSIFNNLLEDTIKCNKKIQNVKKRISNANNKIIPLEKLYTQQPPSLFYDNPDTSKQWSRNDETNKFLFTKESLPESINSRYNICETKPNLNDFNKFNKNNKECIKNYSDTNFFMNEFVKEQQIKLKQQKLKRQKRKEERRIRKLKKLELESGGTLRNMTNRPNSQHIMIIDKPDYNNLKHGKEFNKNNKNKNNNNNNTKYRKKRQFNLGTGTKKDSIKKQPKTQQVVQPMVIKNQIEPQKQQQQQKLPQVPQVMKQEVSPPTQVPNQVPPRPMVVKEEVVSRPKKKEISIERKEESEEEMSIPGISRKSISNSNSNKSLSKHSRKTSNIQEVLPPPFNPYQQQEEVLEELEPKKKEETIKPKKIVKPVPQFSMNSILLSNIRNIDKNEILTKVDFNAIKREKPKDIRSLLLSKITEENNKLKLKKVKKK